MASTKTRRLIVLTAFAAAAAAGPAIAAISTSAPQDYKAYPGQCLAHFGNIENNVCLGYSNGQPISGGTPWGQYGPNNYQNGTMLPGTTINQGIG
ncbi:MAG TPA: hypothetical protein VHT50_07615 [Mycobacterium sp.]|nr:hypothetical protein [Mycobacterium sp.]